MTCINSAFNPFIFYFRGADFQAQIRSLIGRFSIYLLSIYHSVINSWENLRLLFLFITLINSQRFMMVSNGIHLNHFRLPSRPRRRTIGLGSHLKSRYYNYWREIYLYLKSKVSTVCETLINLERHDINRITISKIRCYPSH